MQDGQSGHHGHLAAKRAVKDSILEHEDAKTLNV
jgi:hypothetical protein